DEGDGFSLDRSGSEVALLLDGLEEIGRQAERVEGQVVSCGPDRWLGGRRRARAVSVLSSGPPARAIVVTRTSIPDPGRQPVVSRCRRRECAGPDDRTGAPVTAPVGETGGRGVGMGRTTRTALATPPC